MATVSRTTLVLGAGAGVLGVDQLTPTINWLLNSLPLPDGRPDSTAGLIATTLVVGGTALFHYWQSRQAPPASDATPAADPARPDPAGEPPAADAAN